MAFDRHVIDGKERLVWACRAFDFRLFANPTPPFIRTGRCVAAAPRLAILPTDGEDIRTAAEKPSEQGNLVSIVEFRSTRSPAFSEGITLITAVCSLGADCRVSISAMIAARSRSSAVSRVMRLVILMFVRIIVESGECRRSSSAA